MCIVQCKYKPKCKVCFHSDIPEVSADFTICTHGMGTPSYTVASPVEKILHLVFHQVPIDSWWREVPWCERFAQHICAWLAVCLEHWSVTGGHQSKH